MVILERKDKVDDTLDELFARALDRRESQVS
jgi:hypothetical protein